MKKYTSLIILESLYFLVGNMNVQLFIVFHKNIFDDCYKHIPDDVLYNNFTFFAVNPKIAKEYTPNKYKVINEWELPVYDPTFQERGYNENSAIYHVYANKLHTGHEYIGFFQYDMVFENNVIEQVQDSTKNGSVYFPYSTHDFNFCSFETWNEPYTLQFIINDYIQHFKVPFYTDKEYPLFNSYIIPHETYEKIMEWVVQLYDKLYTGCLQFPNMSHFGHIGGIYERIMAYAIGQENLSIVRLNIDHDNELKKVSY